MKPNKDWYKNQSFSPKMTDLAVIIIENPTTLNCFAAQLSKNNAIVAAAGPKHKMCRWQRRICRRRSRPPRRQAWGRP